MTFDLTTIAVFVVAAAIYAALLPRSLRGWALLVGSGIAIYWLQPRLPIRFSDFMLPTLTLALTVASWWFTRAPDQKTSQEDRIALGVIVALVLGMAGMRFIQADFRLTPSRPPDPLQVALVLAAFAALVFPLPRLAGRERTLTGLLLAIIAFFVVTKAEPLAEAVAGFFRGRAGQDTSLASMNDLGWLGFSYVAFRLIHTVRDRQTGRLPALTLREYVTYVVFFPAFIAGPIDRAERFVKDFRALPDKLGLDAERFSEGTKRIAVGVFKKFVIADTLALGLALNASNADQAVSAPALWFLLYGYALRLFFDFSGYSDIAIGIGILFGITLPENFKQPYLKTNIAAFWQSWHATLSNWARFYVFTPLSRVLLRRKTAPRRVVLSTQLATMIVIGLWHGITVNFLVWGVWHGVGLFIHKQHADRTRAWYRGLSPARKRWSDLFGWFVTFHFVVLGWVWFALPDFEQSVRVFGRLFGVAW